MKIENLIWLHYIVDKLTFKHHVDIGEVEEVFDSRPRFRFVQKASAKERIFTLLWEELRLDAI
jgi:hypothetical protein